MVEFCQYSWDTKFPRLYSLLKYMAITSFKTKRICHLSTVFFQISYASEFSVLFTFMPPSTIIVGEHYVGGTVVLRSSVVR